ncbi:SGNH/GDSL hydrolase family protein [Sphingomonas sp. CGMCC 1.13654]|uniref:SGNH/GDSL hydrolase family protein n=1 Tax=Sphingomonas chungangi TaxID=2683589 RepID=A0A838L2B0_9SPHN|nr:SGNH/GDSL hydrolase family protein [Sphingomonas chungangi]MBA2933521.1 SGNH/GDSL hydrolase family protein [Sphingomonas chungangi]MVW54854.1 SGNH/GDSL hydrolase family protein [Sphingomonas chungangi]
MAWRRTARAILLGTICVIAALIGAVLIVIVVQGKRKPDTSGQYVAMGSSFAAGIGLGPHAPGSPLVCMRTTGGYPHLLARDLALSLVDMTCSGSTTDHILDGGQMFLGPQLDAIGPAARLVTITTGGNDIGYIGGLIHASAKVSAIDHALVGKPPPVDPRAFDKVTGNLVRIVKEARRRAPLARIVLASYPPALPPSGSCPALGISDDAAAKARDAADHLAAATRKAARLSDALFVDMNIIGAEHGVCSADPWINGPAPRTGVPFHPNAEGAQAVADAIRASLDRSR